MFLRIFQYYMLPRLKYVDCFHCSTGGLIPWQARSAARRDRPVPVARMSIDLKCCKPLMMMMMMMMIFIIIKIIILNF